MAEQQDGVALSIAQLMGPDGIPPSAMNDELRDLMNPSISARPLHLPESGRIKTVKNNQFVYFLAFDRCGSNARHERVEQLRAAGWDYATTEDVEMFSADNVKQKNEIRSGDRRLMKIPKQRWQEIRKAQNLAALQQINPTRPNSGPMALGNMAPGIANYYGDDAAIRAGARVSDATQDIQEIAAGGKSAGNASVARVKE
jgi:hypothetical protein